MALDAETIRRFHANEIHNVNEVRAVPVTERVVRRFFKHVTKTPGCWLFSAASSSPYKRFMVDRVSVLAHRFAYSVLVGPIPKGLQIDHLCRNKACVNPAHLEAVTQRVNLLRAPTVVAANAAKTHCPAGHAYDAVVVWRGATSRRCRACHSRNDRTSKLRMRAKRNA